ncbi:oligosaccharide repeat unit polymerase [Cobetia sp. UIB-001]|uniref:O-antigen polymerase n=1 Tax=Cobetia sp. UIB-001 TaxID=2717697 RepID=UPI00384A45F1
MTKSVLSKILVYLFLEVICFLLFALLFVEDVNGDLLVVMSSSCVFLFVFHILILAWILDFKLVSMPFLYSIVMSVYMISPLVLYLESGADGLFYWRYISLDYIAKTIPYLMLSVIAFVLGAGIAIISFKARGPLIKDYKRVLSRHDKLALYIAWSVFIFSITVIIIETISGGGLMPMINGDYHVYSENRKSGEASRLFVATMTWFMPMSIITLNALDKWRLQSCGYTDIIFLLGALVFIVSGDRGTLLAVCASWLILHQLICKNISFGKLVWVCVGVMIFIPTMEIMRNFSFSEWSFSNVISTAINVSSNEKFSGSTLLAMLGPFSPSLMTFMGTLMKYDGGEAIRLGSDYIFALLSAIPFNSSMAPNNSMQIHNYLIPDRKGGPGYMAVAEFFINFHVLGVIFGHLILGYLTTRMQYSMHKLGISAIKVAFYATVFFALLLWIRNEFSGLLQVTFYWSICFLLLPVLLKRLLPWRYS